MSTRVNDPPAGVPAALIALGPLVARVPAALRVMAALHAGVYGRTRGRLAGRWFGGSVLVLCTVGRRTGRPRATPLVFLRYGHDLIVVAANGGAPRHPDWWLNLRATGRGVAILGRDDLTVRAREASGAEREQLWRGLAGYVPVDLYQARTSRAARRRPHPRHHLQGDLMMPTVVEPTRPHILIVGGGYVGMYTALRLQKRLRRGEATVTVVDPQPNMTYQPFLAEAAAGSIEARHVVVPLRRVLPRCRVLTATVTAVDHDRRMVTVQNARGEPSELSYDQLVLAPGSVSRTLPVPGLAESGIGFTTIGEAVWLRNHVLSRLDDAAATADETRRRRMLTFVVVGGGYSGVEVAAELQDMAHHALRRYPELSASPLRWVLVEAAERILPEVSGSLADYTVARLRERGMEIALRTRVESMVGGHVVLTDGQRFDAETIVWTAGVRAHPLIARTGLPTGPGGRLLCTPGLRVVDVPAVWSAGDCAAVPDLSRADVPDAVCGPSAQHAVRQANLLARNILATLRGQSVKPYRHAYAGSVAGLGLRKGVAEIYGVKLRGWPAWLLHRIYHLTRVPTLNRKVRVVADWTLALLFRREVVSLGQVQHPRDAWELSNRDAA